ncbi:Endolytic murein transglycosylase [subsurface metagenome]
MWPFPLRVASFRWVAAICAAGIFAFLAFRYLVLSWPVPVIFRDSISIPEGVSAYQVARMLKERSLISNESIFVNAVRLKFGTRAIKAGNYQLFNIRHIGDLVEQILRPRVRAVTITIPEGFTREQVARFIDAKYSIDITRFLALTEDKGFIRSLDLEVHSLEGYLFPDTYRIRNGNTEEEIITHMVRPVQQALGEEISRQGLALGLDLHEILTMASIIEGEARMILSVLLSRRYTTTASVAICTFRLTPLSSMPSLMAPDACFTGTMSIRLRIIPIFTRACPRVR